MSDGGHDHDHEHDHGHAHDHGDDHAPPSDEDGALTHYQMLEIAMRELLIEKGVITADEVRAGVEEMDGRTPERGARVNRRGLGRNVVSPQRLVEVAASARRVADRDPQIALPAEQLAELCAVVG